VSDPLPPPDPNEYLIGEPPGDRVAAPMTVFVGGEPTEADEKIADALLNLRPGVLIVGLRRRTR
jgi:hypothetical protein